jgi:ribosome biogenesis GTPase
VAGGLIADTPGFSSLDYEVDNIPELNRCFVEIYEVSAACKFRECTHTHEPDCAVKVAVAAGEIAQSRFDSFLQLSSEINKTREVYKKNARKTS